MKVLFISHVSDKYGAGRSLLALIDGLNDRGVTSYVILPGKGPLVTELANRSVQYTVMPLKRWASRGTTVTRRVLRGCFNLLVSAIISAKARAWEADIIYTNSSVTPVGAFAALLAGKPHVWHIREFGQEDYGLSFDLGFRASATLIEMLSSEVVVVSEAVRSKYDNYICPERLTVVYNPVGRDVEARFLSGDAGSVRKDISTFPPMVAVVGRIHPGKGQMDALLAVAALIREGTAVDLKFVGDGDPDDLDRLKQAVNENDVGEYVEFTGFVDDPLSVMQEADVILVCSRSEAFGRVTIESMITRTAVIGTRSGATPELIKEGFNGLLYEPGDHRSLTESIKYLVTHREEAERMGRNGFEWASDRFTVARYADAVYGVLEAAAQE